jgi:hypothetical protein
MRVATRVRAVGVVCLWITLAGYASAATINVPIGGDLQAALNAAQPGDVITLQPGASYVGNFVLPNKGAQTAFITIRSAAADSALPPAGVRITPAYAAQLPKIHSANSTAALRTAAATNHWKLMCLEFQANQNGYGDIIDLGAGDTSQTLLTQVPYALVLDRVYVHGDPVMGQKRGISLNSSDTQILNSWVSDIKTVGQDTQAIGGYNGPGNYLIENNYLEAATENVLFGGSDPLIANLVTTNITFRRNYLSKPLAWRDPIVATPVGVSALAAPGTGTLAAGTYFYKVIARKPAGQGNTASSSPSTEVSATLAVGTSGGVTISWTPVVGASEYVVFGRTTASENMSWKTTNPYFTDTGVAGTTATPGSATKWAVKNIFELKNAQDVLIEGNVFENVWIAAQSGYAICLTPRNQNGTAPWSVVQRVTFQHNIVRHAAGGLDILGTDNLAPSQLTNHLTIRDNLFDDLGPIWGSGSKTILMGPGGDAFTFDHNTFITADSTIISVYGGTATTPTPITNVVYSNNMSEHRTYGIFGDNIGMGLIAINAYLPGSTIVANVLAGGSASKYPVGNFFPTVAAWDAGFVNYAAGDYHLLATSPYKNAGTDAADLGADIDRIKSETANALTGDNRVPAGTTTVKITTTALPDGILMQSYRQAIDCTGASGGCAWQATNSSLPAGVGFDASTGAVSGTPLAIQTGTVTVTAFDPAAPANTATTTLTLTIDPAPFVMTMPAAGPAQVGVPYQISPSVSGAVSAVVWSIAPGYTLPAGLGIDQSSGAIKGVPAAWGTSTAVVEAQDTWSASRVASQPVTITVAPAQLVVTTASLASGITQAMYSATLNATGGTGATTWSLSGGTLPAGMTLNASGTISGVPTVQGTFPITVRAVDVNWPSNTASASLVLVVNAAAFADSWTHQDIGAVGVAGSATYSSSTSTFTVTGAGADVWGTADALQYAYVPLAGDGRIVARLTSVQHVSAWTKAGVMIRETLSPGSAQAFMLVSAGKGLAFQRRRATGSISVTTAGAAAKAPYWVRLDRAGNTITAYQSPDGAAWTLVGTDTIPMAATVYVGLGVSSHTTAAAAAATFDRVVVTR